MLEIPNCSIKQTSKTTLEGAEETYLSGKLVLEGEQAQMDFEDEAEHAT